MKKLTVIALTGIAAAAVAGTALAAAPRPHVLNVALPDGSVARVEYVGDVPPRVTVAPESSWSAGFPALGAFDAAFANMDRQIDAMMRQSEAMIRQAQQMASSGHGAPGMNVASFGAMPQGASSVSVVSFSNGAATCTRTTQVVSQGAGKPPKVTTSVSGNCSAQARPAPRAAPQPAPAALDRT